MNLRPLPPETSYDCDVQSEIIHFGLVRTPQAPVLSPDSADVVLLAAADAVANRTAEVMGDAAQKAVVVPFRPDRCSRA